KDHRRPRGEWNQRPPGVRRRGGKRIVLDLIPASVSSGTGSRLPRQFSHLLQPLQVAFHVLSGLLERRVEVDLRRADVAGGSDVAPDFIERAGEWPAARAKRF